MMSIMPTQHVLDSDMPQLFQAADAASLAGQRRYVGGTRLRLALVAAAALCGIASWRVGEGEIDMLALLAVVCFVAALLVEGVLWKGRPDKAWYDARAVAESAKTLAWKFSVCGEPFPRSMSDTEAVRALLDRLETVCGQYPALELKPVDAEMVSKWMRTQRSAARAERIEIYLNARIREQRSWYSTKAEYNGMRSKQWRASLVILEFAGFLFALLEALNPSMPALSAAFAALIGSVVAWVETKQHDFNSRAYGAAVTDLAKAETKLLLVADESDWAREVNDAEDAISREHTLWLASRSQ
ncbi:MAG: DUF4231 domain-containing protein [Nocardioides sp.]